ncbi:hypothetical protein JX266_004213 [Neoarthrinium moseri]|uniref:uncharacterized protein n=1 Tax=Neoarthrinium moseri TaxID=1658444 RepID=UPI001FDE58CC|nr:uncharacterized protein JN550_007561 [Neoarthrinium moseri]KAI1850355.1 hypothetical protein JX266_004213 [Neoarthrinium moseri]KAI1866708.1 hypothetical protein JN550_007561 [Neoarthrinium moseri]
MHFSQIFVLPLFSVVAVSGLAIREADNVDGEAKLAKRNCYPGGVNWGNEYQVALDAVDIVCRDEFVGHYDGLSEWSVCYNLSAGKRVNFNVRRWAGTPGDLSFELCQKYLRLEIVGCGMGGQSYQGNWRFMSDPNSGTC